MEMPMSEDLTLEILIEIRDEIRSTNQHVDTTNSRLDQTNLKLEQLGTDLRGEIAVTRSEFRDGLDARELRNATRIAEQTAATRDLYTLLTDRLDLRDRVTRCESDIDEIKGALKKPNGSS
jgi:chromosome segregation ATPase